MKGTEGRVKLTVYEGGTQGDERTVIRLMRPEVDQLQRLAPHRGGLGHIDDAFNVFGIPFFFASDAEARNAREKLTPILSKRLEAKGFHLVHWGHAGWVQLFSKTPIKALAELKTPEAVHGRRRRPRWCSGTRSNGFKPVALTVDRHRDGAEARTGLINAAPSPPYAAPVIADLPERQLHARHPRGAAHRRALSIANASWAQISADDRRSSSRRRQAIEKRLNTEAPGQDAEAIDDDEAAQQRFTVVTLDAEGAGGVPRRGGAAGHARCAARWCRPTCTTGRQGARRVPENRRQIDARRRALRARKRPRERSRSAGIMLLPLAEIVSRKVLRRGPAGDPAPFAQNLTLWVGMLGAAIAAREGKLLTLATGEFLPEGTISTVAHVVAGAAGAAIATILAIGGIALVRSDEAAGDVIALGVPVWIADARPCRWRSG